MLLFLYAKIKEFGLVLAERLDYGLKSKIFDSMRFFKPSFIE